MLCGVVIVVIGVAFILFEKMELSKICPFGGETPDVAAYCLAHENYYIALFWLGLIAIIAGIFLFILGSRYHNSMDQRNMPANTHSKAIEILTTNYSSGEVALRFTIQFQ